MDDLLCTVLADGRAEGRKIGTGCLAVRLLKADSPMDPGGGCFGECVVVAFDTQRVTSTLSSKLLQGSHPSFYLDRCSFSDCTRHLSSNSVLIPTNGKNERRFNA